MVSMLLRFDKKELHKLQRRSEALQLTSVTKLIVQV